MKAIVSARQQATSAIAALQTSLSTDEPDELATAYATAGDAVARAIAAMDFSKGFRADVQRQAEKLAQRA